QLGGRVNWSSVSRKVSAMWGGTCRRRRSCFPGLRPTMTTRRRAVFLVMRSSSAPFLANARTGSGPTRSRRAIRAFEGQRSGKVAEMSGRRGGKRKFLVGDAGDLRSVVRHRSRCPGQPGREVPQGPPGGQVLGQLDPEGEVRSGEAPLLVVHLLLVK